MNTIKRGDVFFCLGSPEAVGSEERKTRPVVIVQNDAGNASSPTVIVANMTTNTARRLYPMQFDILLPGRALSRVQCEQIRTFPTRRSHTYAARSRIVFVFSFTGVTAFHFVAPGVPAGGRLSGE